MYSKEDDIKIQSAISFLVENFNKSGHNPKPVILHCMRVSMYLYKLQVKPEIVVAALLHDLLEDTDVTSPEIEQAFGKDILNLVEANTFKSEITDYIEQYIETFKRNLEHGPDAALIKAADILDNSDYYHLAPQKMQEKLWGKLKKFLELSKPLIGETEVWKDLNKKLPKQ